MEDMMDKGWDFGLPADDLAELLEALRQDSEASSGLLQKLVQEERASAMAGTATKKDIQRWNAQVKIVRRRIARLSTAVDTAITRMTSLDEALDALISFLP